jgi:ankyrin repeat protein
MDILHWYMLQRKVILILFNILFQKEQILKQKTMIFSLIHLYGNTSLMYASIKGHLNIVQYLISKGANIEAKNEYIFYHSSLWMDFVDICFIRRSSWYCSISYFKRSEHWNKKKIYFLSFIFMERLRWYVLHPIVNLILLNSLFQKEQTLKQKTIIFSINHIYGNTSLILASFNGHLNIVQYLFSKGANIKAKNNNIFHCFL